MGPRRQAMPAKVWPRSRGRLDRLDRLDRLLARRQVHRPNEGLANLPALSGVADLLHEILAA